MSNGEVRNPKSHSGQPCPRVQRDKGQVKKLDNTRHLDILVVRSQWTARGGSEGRARLPSQSRPRLKEGPDRALLSRQAAETKKKKVKKSEEKREGRRGRGVSPSF